MNTTVKQDTELANAVLDLCRKSSKVNHLSLPLSLRSHSHLLDGKPIENDPTTFEEKVRSRKFSRYCLAVMDFLVMAKLCYYVEEVIDNFGYPHDIEYLRITRLGATYARLPFSIQRVVIYFMEKAFWTKHLFTKYKWVGTTITALVGGIGWLRTHDITSYLVTISVVAGAVAMLVANWLHGGATASESVPNDDPLF